MKNEIESTFGYDDGDVDTNRSAAITLNELADQRYSRRQMLRGSSAIMAATMGGSALTACGSTDTLKQDSAPTVNAGAAGTTNSGRMVTLAGTASDDGKVGAVAWKQTDGPKVTLNNANTNNASFLAPTVSSATTLTFQFTAADLTSHTASATTTVTVNPPALGFTAVAKNQLDTVTVPAGYSVQVINRTGDPIAATVPAYMNDGTDTNFAQRIGDHGDALYWYGLDAKGGRDPNNSTRGLLVQNHENINSQYLHPNGSTTVNGARPESEAIKEIECHGVSITEVSEGPNRAWSMKQDSSFNRRITPSTPMVFSGPAKGSDLLKTAYSPSGTEGRGTINNCANGTTPWGSALTCEENWAGYFRRNGDDANRTPKELTALLRSGVTSKTGNYGWATVVPADPANTLFRRWDARAGAAPATATDDYRNEPNQFGWVVEIDPYDPKATPRKRTALGRFAHEGCWPGLFVAGKKPAWYMGDDSKNEYIYKFVSDTPWSAADADTADRLAIGDKYLDKGTLYVAKYNADGTGTWRPLVFGENGLDASNARYPFADQADVLVNPRLAADALGATPMDRPEWTGVNPVNSEIYVTLTNNSSRTLNNTDAANPRYYNDPYGPKEKPNYGNNNGHILRMKEADTEALDFKWDIYAFGAGADLDPANINVSALDDSNDFSSPDGLAFARTTHAGGQVKPMMWVQTDDSAYTDVTNCMMLAAQPGSVGDGGARTIINKDASGATASQATLVGAAPGDNLRRFLVGPIESEITGVDSTPDGRTLFVGIQHPGEKGKPNQPSSHWPDSQNGTAAETIRPRSAVVVITKDDGGVVGL